MTVWDRGVYVDIAKTKYKYKTIFKQNTKKNFINKFKNYYFEKILKYSPLSYLHKRFIKDNYDVEIAFLEGISTKIIAGGDKKIKKFAWVHIDMAENRWYEQFYINKQSIVNTYLKFNRIFTVSEYCKESFSNLFNINSNISTLYNPIDDRSIIFKSHIKTDAVSNIDKLKLVTVGRLEKQKGYDRLINVAARLKDEGQDFELYIIGIGSMLDELKKLINIYNLKDNVFILGYCENPYNIMKRCDLFVCSSRSEGFSTSVIEALVLGIPVITTNCSGMIEILGENEFGIIVNNDEESLYKGLTNLLLNNNIIREYAEKAKQRGKSFKLDKSMKKIERLLSN